MLNDEKIVAFLAIADAGAARAFYGGQLGLTIRYEDDFALVLSSAGVELRLQKLPAVTPAAHTVMGWSVEDISAVTEHLTGRGVVFERFEGMNQDLAGVWTSPSGARIAWFEDPDGNVLSLTQHVG